MLDATVGDDVSARAATSRKIKRSSVNGEKILRTRNWLKQGSPGKKYTMRLHDAGQRRLLPPPVLPHLKGVGPLDLTLTGEARGVEPGEAEAVTWVLI